MRKDHFWWQIRNFDILFSMEKLPINKGVKEGERVYKGAGEGHVETPNAQYSVMYGLHVFEQSPDFVDDVDAVLLEMMFSKDDAGYLSEWATEKLPSITQYRAIIKKAKELSKPVFITDYIGEPGRVVKESITSKALSALEALLGGHLLLNKGLLSKEDIETTVPASSLTRREFLKQIGNAGKYIGATYLLVPTLRTVVGLSDILSNVPIEVNRPLNKIVETIHPELDSKLLEGRNDLIAAKSETVAEILFDELKIKPRLGIVIGGAHTGIEDSLKKLPQERLDSIRGYFKDETGRQATIIRIDFKGEETMVTLLKDSALTS